MKSACKINYIVLRLSKNGSTRPLFGVFQYRKNTELIRAHRCEPPTTATEEEEEKKFLWQNRKIAVGSSNLAQIPPITFFFTNNAWGASEKGAERHDNQAEVKTLRRVTV